jgi:hypothetical protein
MDAYRGIRIGLVVQCENGYFAGGANGGGVYDNRGTRVKQFTSTGSHLSCRRSCNRLRPVVDSKPRPRRHTAGSCRRSAVDHAVQRTHFIGRKNMARCAPTPAGGVDGAMVLRPRRRFYPH